MIKTIDTSKLGIVNRLLAGNLRVSIWTARKKLTPKDLRDAELPPDHLASLGSKKICDPAALKIFHTLKARAIGVLDLYGLEFLGGWAIPESVAMTVHQKLEAIELEFNDAKEDFLLNYNKNVQEWVDRQDEWADIIEDSVESADYVRSRISFQSRFFSVAMPGMTGEGTDVLCEGFHEEVAGLGNALFDDVAQAATDAWRNSFLGQDKVSHKALSPLRKIHDKLVSFSFVDPVVLPITEIIQAALDCVPRRGYIEGLPLIQLQGLVSLLRDTEALADLAKRKLDGLATEDILAGFIPADMLQVSEPKEECAGDIEAEQVPPLAADVQTEHDDAMKEAEGHEVVHQPALVPAYQPVTSSGNFNQPSLMDFMQTASSGASQQHAAPMRVSAAQNPFISTMPATVASEQVNVQAMTAEMPMPKYAEEAAPQAVPVIAAETVAFSDEDVVGKLSPTEVFQPETAIPMSQGGMGDFLDGFI